MSLMETCCWTLVRTIVLCLVAWPIAVRIERCLRSFSDTRRPIELALLLAPFLFPELLVGYAYRNAALAYPNLAELLCAVLLFVRIVPVGVVTLLISPSSLTGSAAIHCRWMLLRTNPGDYLEWWQLALCYWHGPIRRAMPAMGLMGLVAFQEFELAALLQTISWTDWFVTAQRLGLAQNEMLMQTRWPLLMQLPLLLGIMLWISNRKATKIDQSESSQFVVSNSTKMVVIAYLILALTLGCLIPLGIVAWRLPAGLSLLVRQTSQWSGLAIEIATAGTISVCAGMTAWFVGFAWSESRHRQWFSSIAWQVLLVPGLIGSLLLSLVTVELFQQSWLRTIYDSPLPWVLTLIVWLLPRAALLHLWLGGTTKTESVHLAELLIQPNSTSSVISERVSPTNSNTVSSSSPPRHLVATLLFRLRDQPRLLGMSLMCYWAYLDLSTAYLLAPTKMPSGLVRLYNFMHFGRSAALSAESMFFFGLPVFVALAVFQFSRVWRCHRNQ